MYILSLNILVTEQKTTVYWWWGWQWL